MKIQVPFNYNDELRKAMNYYLEKRNGLQRVKKCEAGFTSMVSLVM